MTGPERADAAVIGAGVTGLATARRLAELRPGWRIVLIEAGRAGSGASGRSAGFLPDAAERAPDSGLARLQGAGLERLRRRVQTDCIFCDWNEAGWIHGATTEAEAVALGRLADRLRRAGQPFRELDDRALAATTGSRIYRGGLRAGGATVQPAALVRGLAAALPVNVELFEESPVVRIRAGRSPRLETATGGEATCGRLFVAADAGTPDLGLLRRRIIPLALFASLSRPLTGDERAALGCELEWAVADEALPGTSLRRTADGRLFLCGGLRYGSGHADEVRALHRRLLRSRFPQLPELDLEHTWPGLLALTRNRLPRFGKLESGIFAAAGFSGSGLALGTICGELLADLALGVGSDLLRDALSLPQPGWVPPEPLLGWGVRALLRRLRG